MKCPYCSGTGDLPATFGALVLKARKDAGMTQAELAPLVGVTRAHIANIETDRTDVPLTTLMKLAQALSVKPKDLVP